jgi:hypothetical protein
MREAFDDWSLDMNKLLDPMLPNQLGSPSNPMDTASEIAWDVFLHENSSTVGQYAGTVHDYTSLTSA